MGERGVRGRSRVEVKVVVEAGAVVGAEGGVDVA